MQCPECHDPMIIVETDGVELDLCAAQHGSWFDAQELRQLFLGAGMDGQLADFAERLATLPSTSAGRRCPRCRTRMQQVVLPGGDGPVLDRCPRGDGLWFDRGELRTLIAAVAGGAQDFGPVAAYLESFVAAMDGEAA